MAAKKKGPGKGRGPATRPASPAKRTTIPKSAAAKLPTAAKNPAAPGPTPSSTPAPASPPGPSSPPAPPANSGQSSKPGPSAKSGQSSKPAPSATPGPSSPPAPPAKSGQSSKPGPQGKPGQSSKLSPPAKAGSSSKSGSPRQAAAPSANADPITKRRPRGGPTREERLAAAAAARRKQSIRNRALLAAGVVAALVVVSFVIVSDRRERDQEAAQLESGSCRFDRESDPDGGPNRNHTPTPTYKLNPPAGGNHTPQAAGAGIFTEANAPVDGQIVHAMEHGYVVLWYRPDLDEASLNTYRELAQRHERDVLVVPRPSLEQPVAATAWHARLLCDAVDVDATERFINAYVNEGPEKVPH